MKELKRLTFANTRFHDFWGYFNFLILQFSNLYDVYTISDRLHNVTEIIPDRLSVYIGTLISVLIFILHSNHDTTISKGIRYVSIVFNSVATLRLLATRLFGYFSLSSGYCFIKISQTFSYLDLLDFQISRSHSHLDFSADSISNCKSSSVLETLVSNFPFTEIQAIIKIVCVFQ